MNKQKLLIAGIILFIMIIILTGYLTISFLDSEASLNQFKQEVRVDLEPLTLTEFSELNLGSIDRQVADFKVDSSIEIASNPFVPQLDKAIEVEETESAPAEGISTEDSEEVVSEAESATEPPESSSQLTPSEIKEKANIEVSGVLETSTEQLAVIKDLASDEVFFLAVGQKINGLEIKEINLSRVVVEKQGVRADYEL